MDFEDELEKRILELGFTKDHPPSAILEFGMENLRQIAFKVASEDKYTNIEEIQNWRFSRKSKSLRIQYTTVTPTLQQIQRNHQQRLNDNIRLLIEYNQ